MPSKFKGPLKATVTCPECGELIEKVRVPGTEPLVDEPLVVVQARYRCPSCQATGAIVITFIKGVPAEEGE